MNVENPMLESTRIAHPRGGALVLVMITMTLIAAAVLFFIQLTNTENQGTDALRRFSISDAMAEAGTQYAIRTAQNAVANYSTPPSSGTVSISNSNVVYFIKPVPGAPVRTEVFDGKSLAWVPYKQGMSGFTRTVYPYIINATANFQETAGGQVAQSTVNKVVEIHAQPLFQFLAFYGDAQPLEITTGPDAIFTGRIHSNKDLYFGNSSYAAGASQTYNTDYLHTAGKLHHGRLDNFQGQPASTNFATGGTLKVKVMGTDGSNPNNYQELESKYKFDNSNPIVPSYTGFDSMFNGFDQDGGTDYSSKGDVQPFNQLAPSRYGGTIQTAAQGVEPLSVPKPGSLNAFVPDSNNSGNYNFDSVSGKYVPTTPGTGSYDKGYYNANATLVIKYDSTAGKSIVYDSTGKDITSTLPPGTITDVPASPPSDPNAVGNKQMFDGRQNTWVGLTEVNMRLLNTVPQFANAPDGVLIYAYREDSTPTQPNGIRLVEGQTLSNRMTLVSEDPVYVQGDFNTGQPVPFKDNGNGVDVKTGTSIDSWTNTNKTQGSAVMADAVNVLSNAWPYVPADGQKNNPSQNNALTKMPGQQAPNSVGTIANFAMLSGQMPSVAGTSTYSGGLENFQRFHENWSGKILNYKGSFVNLFNSKKATANWSSSTKVYVPPVRHWDFDTSFMDPTKLPPFTPLVVGTAQVVWWK